MPEVSPLAWWAFCVQQHAAYKKHAGREVIQNKEKVWPPEVDSRAQRIMIEAMVYSQPPYPTDRRQQVTFVGVNLVYRAIALQARKAREHVTAAPLQDPVTRMKNLLKSLLRLLFLPKTVTASDGNASKPEPSSRQALDPSV